jgi:PAS domain S-box-containing protein
LTEAARDRRVVQVDELAQRFGLLACGPYPESPRTAFVMPINVFGLERPFGLLVAGVSPRRALDEPYRTFYLMLRDAVTNALTTARAYEEERRRAEARRESEERFRMLADNISQFAWTCDLLGNVTWYNKRWLDYTGLTFEEMKGWGWSKVQHPDHVERVVERVRRSSETGEPWEDTFPLRGKDGGYRWFLSRAMPIRDEQGNFVQWFGTNTDVTEQVLAEEQVARQAQELRALNKRLQELDRLKNEFFSNVSHEFRTPLTLMLGPVEDILANPEDGLPPENRELLTVVRRNSLRLLKLVNMLLDFSRIEAGRIEASYEPTDLAALTADLASVFRSAVEKAGMKLIVDCPPIEEPVYVDREMWEKIVLNLLSNAFKFTFEGEIEVRLRRVGAASGADPAFVELTVRDTGTGIPAEELPRLFERFHRVKGARGRTFEGSGIGLAFVQELVKLHGGAVRVTSEVDRGSSFTVTIPLGKSHLPADRVGAARTLVSKGLRGEAYVEEALRWLPSEEEGQRNGVTEGWGGGEGESVEARDASLSVSQFLHLSAPSSRVLLADDNADMREYARRLLGRGYEVEAVGDGLAALNVARERAPDLVLTDVMMPGLDGLGLLRELRADERLKTVPVILISARAGEESVASGLEAGADDYLVKPFSARELLARVDSTLKLARVRREAQERIVGVWESVTDGFIAFDRDWRYIYINAAAESIGLRRSELLGRTLWEAFPDVLWTEIETQFRRAAAERTPVEVEYYYPAWGRWFDNKVFPAADGGVTVYVRDVTERKRAEEERARLLESERAARRQAEEASRLKDEFLATVSHELRTPLNSINGWARLLRGGAINGEQAERALETIERNAKSQNQLINDLLDVSRIITGKMRLDVRPVRLGSVIEDAVESVRPSAEAKEIRLSALLDPSADMVSGDAERLQQVVWNLLSNAIKFTQKGGRVQVRLERVDSHVEITVADNGQGVKPEFLPHVFDRFRQEEGGTGRQHGGLGLGLAIVRHLVELHGGTVRVDSAGLNQGATFTVALPIIPVRTAAPNGKREAGYDRAAPLKKLPSIGGARVLLVDDDADGRELVVAMLAQGGAETRTAGSAEEALAMLDEWRPDALISDIGMPGEDGYALIEKLRARERGRGERLLPAIALTAYARVEDRLRALSAGYQSHVSKPVDTEELLTVIASLLISQNIRPEGNDDK